MPEKITGISFWTLALLQRVSCSDLQKFIEVQDRFVRVADREILVDHPRDLHSREKAYSLLCSFFFNEDSSLKSPLMILLRPRLFFESRSSKFVCNFAQ